MSEISPRSEQSICCPADVERALEVIAGLLTVMTRVRPQENTADRHDGQVFRMHAGRLDDEEQGFNFAWRDVRVCWHKSLGRSMMINRPLVAEEILTMTRECCGEILSQSLSRAGGF